MKILHIVPGLEEPCNGIAVVAKLLAREQNAKLVDAKLISRAMVYDVDEVWVHSCWTPWVWRACRFAIAERKRLVRMLHGNLDPLRLAYHRWKKRLVGPIERLFLRRTDNIVATCEAEEGWIHSYLGKRCPPIKITDIKRFFDFSRVEEGNGCRVEREDRVEGEISGHKAHKERKRDGMLHFLYLGRRHPLKGLEHLEKAVEQISSVPHSPFSVPPQLKVVSNAFGEEKEKVWEWCDVLVLPTLSENFGLVVAEALERGKRVITTDGAPAWGDGNDYGGRLVYLRGYRDGAPDNRVRLLKVAMTSLMDYLERQ